MPDMIPEDIKKMNMLDTISETVRAVATEPTDE
jgi:hypothetical protein